MPTALAPVASPNNPYVSCEFDLALKKLLAPGQSSKIHIGDDVKFRIWVYNQGFATAKNIQVVDYLPVGTILSATGNQIWSTLPNGQVSTTVAGPLVLGDSAFVDINVRVVYGQNGATLINRAEIASATDLDGVLRPDVDSKPDATNGNDNEINNIINQNGGGTNDEDDEDPEPITLEPTDPIGYIYCDKTGKIVPRRQNQTGFRTPPVARFSSASARPATRSTASDGIYQFFTNGQPGTYNFTWEHPLGYPLSTTCLPQHGRHHARARSTERASTRTASRTANSSSVRTFPRPIV